MNLIVDIVSATLNRAKPTASSLQAVPGNNTRTALGGRGKTRQRHRSRPLSLGFSTEECIPLQPGAASTKHSLLKRRTMEQQPFKRVGQENFTTNPKIQQCWQKGGWGLVQGLKVACWKMDARVLDCVWDRGGSRVSPGRDFLKSQPDTGTGSRSLRPDSARHSGTASSRTRRCPSRSARRRSQGGTRNDSRSPSPEREREKPGLTPCSCKFD